MNNTICCGDEIGKHKIDAPQPRSTVAAYSYRDLARTISEMSEAQKDSPVTVQVVNHHGTPGGLKCLFRPTAMLMLNPTNYERTAPVLLAPE